MTSQSTKLKVGILPGVADLYNRLWPDIQDILNHLVHEVAAELQSDELEVLHSPAVSTPSQVEAACKSISNKEPDLLVVALAPYCPSGVLAPSLTKTDVPLVLWPMQAMLQLDPKNYDAETIKLNHGVHAVQDLANVLGKSGKAFGVIHGHHRQKDFVEELKCWVRAGRAIRAMQQANPIQIGGHFVDMLDLQIGEERFLKKMGLEPRLVSLDEFSTLLRRVNKREMEHCIERYKSAFEMGPGVDEAILSKTARGEAVLRKILAREDSHACGLNFLALCNDNRIGDALHVAASIVMQEGYGYAGEGDWVTAVLVRAMQQAVGAASFSEMFSIGYADNRLLLKHWGEGNFAMARAKPKLLRSQFTDENTAEFAIVDFEFAPGPATLINLNSTPDSQGRLISITGTITQDHLPKVDGPRAVFDPACEDVRRLLTEYAYSGGSHHLALANGDCTETLEKVCRLAGWSYIKL